MIPKANSTSASLWEKADGLAENCFPNIFLPKAMKVARSNSTCVVTFCDGSANLKYWLDVYMETKILAAGLLKF